MTTAIGITIQDEASKKSRLTFNFQDGLTTAEIIELYGELEDLLKSGTNPLCIGGIVAASALINLTPDPTYLSAADLARVEYGGLFDFLVTGGFHTSFRIPAFNEVHVADGGSEIVQSSTEVSALIVALRDGITLTGGTVAQLKDYRGTDVVAISSAAEDHKSQRR